MDNIKIVRLTTGEELICLTEVSSTGYTLKDVAILIPTQSNQLGLAPFMAYSNAKDGIETQSKNVMFVVEPVTELKNQYQQMFSKLVTPSNSKLIV